MVFALAAACFLALGQGVLALRYVASGAQDPPGSYRQRLENHHDLQYYGTIMIGGQPVRGVLDTGSFELVVFSRECTTCGTAAAYLSSTSSSFVEGRRQRQHTYGSGSCDTWDARELFAIGNLRAESQSFCLAVRCNMPVLDQAAFNAIVGIGPPGQQLYTAQKSLEELRSLESRYQEAGLAMPEVAKTAMRDFEEDIEDSRSKPSMLESFGIGTFSVCFGHQSGSPAWIVWNDTRPVGQPGYQQLHVVGRISWGVQLLGVSLIGGPADTSLGCEDGCAAVLDTGTSLLGVPSAIFQRLHSLLTESNLDCTDLRQLPSLRMNLAGTEVLLPPDSYLGTLEGAADSEAETLLHTDQINTSSETMCQLLLMDIGQETTQFGPMFILGMPFFRQFYTTFDVGTGPEDRSIFFTPADDHCHPASTSGAASLRRERRMKPRAVDVSKVRAPTWLKNRHGIQI